VKVQDVTVLAETLPDFKSEPDQPVWLAIDLDQIRVYDPQTTEAIAP
jgi:hypothetical protein